MFTSFCPLQFHLKYTQSTDDQHLLISWEFISILFWELIHSLCVIKSQQWRSSAAHHSPPVLSSLYKWTQGTLQTPEIYNSCQPLRFTCSPFPCVWASESTAAKQRKCECLMQCVGCGRWAALPYASTSLTCCWQSGADEQVGGESAGKRKS